MSIHNKIESVETVIKPTREEAEKAVRTLISWTGDNPDREGLIETPKRVVKAYEEFFEGYNMDPEEVLTKTFEEKSRKLKGKTEDLNAYLVKYDMFPLFEVKDEHFHEQIVSLQKQSSVLKSNRQFSSHHSDISSDCRIIRNIEDIFRSKPNFLTYQDPSKHVESCVKFCNDFKERFINTYPGLLNAEKLIDEEIFDMQYEQNGQNVEKM